MVREDDCKRLRTHMTTESCSENSKCIGSTQLFEVENPVYFGTSRYWVTFNMIWTRVIEKT